MQLAVGEFVRIDASFDVGKVIAVNGDVADVSRFHSVARRETGQYTFSRLARTLLPAQTRVYFQEPNTNVWRIGRVSASRGERPALEYLVAFPNQDGAFVRERDLFTRSIAPTVDPTETLASFGAETQFFHDRRIRLLRELITFRAGSHGLTGLLSASASLAPHQLHAVQRVLEDPIQRYLLADEVGLGKTVEAGAIIRQWLIDSNTDRIAIVTPRPLARQWEHELSAKFNIDRSAPEHGRLSVFPFDQVGEINPAEWQCLVVDEAHHLVAGGANLEQISSSPMFAPLRNLSQSCSRVLFLTATPVIGNEPGALALLHLLDPTTHPLDDLDGFRAKLARREEYARLMQRLNPQLPSGMLRFQCDALLRALPDDERLADLIGLLSQATTPERRREAIGAVRIHIGDTYRIHQRLIRTRRAEVGGSDALRSRSGPWCPEYDEDTRTPDLADLLESWRNRASSHALVIADQDGGRALASLAEVYIDLVEALGQSTESLNEAVTTRQANLLSQANITFPEESEVLSALANTVGHVNEGKSRAQALAEVIRDLVGKLRQPNEPAKVVAFSSSRPFAHALKQQLDRALGFDRAFLALSDLPDADLDTQVERFRSQPNSAVLIADVAGEEGINLQLAHAIVHCDLPFRPDRIEQRIGRLDRFGRKLESITHCVTLPVDYGSGPWQQWAELLREGFGVFDQSISEVQFVLTELRTMIVRELFQTGSISEQAPHIKSRLDTERERVRLQYQLDQSDADIRNARFLHKELLEAEARENDLSHAVLEYVADALKLHVNYSNREPSLFNVTWSPTTLVPEHMWRQFAPASLSQMWYTGRRTVATSMPGARLLRPGCALADLLLHFLRCDDRGAAFSTWRHHAGWQHDDWLGFRLCYLVEAIPDTAIGFLGADYAGTTTRALQRRADALFPPMYETVYLDATLTLVTDAAIVALLDAPYREASTPGGFDYNLSSRSENLLSLVSPASLLQTCMNVRARSEELLRQSHSFTNRMHEARTRSVTTLGARVARVEARRRALLREHGLSQEQEGAFARDLAIDNALIAAVEAPRVCLDAIGLYVLSGMPPSSVASNRAVVGRGR